ncbi:MAG: YkgJ family cysteine cluster protein [Treponema sp.]|nr:YkgJ family cysteine cluster protein [Treponema sp.]
MAAQKRPFYARGLRFSCTRCSACCRYDSGFVFLSGQDVSRLGAALGAGYEEFTGAFCRWVPSENGGERLSLKEKSNYDCIFWSPEKDGCSVYEARPVQCRAFPFWPSVLQSEKNWELTASGCPGMGRGPLQSPNSIKKWLVWRQNEPIISRSI